MQHDLFSSLDSFLSVPAGSGGLLIRDVTGQYRPAEADEVLLTALPASPVVKQLDNLVGGSLCAWRWKSGQIQHLESVGTG